MSRPQVTITLGRSGQVIQCLCSYSRLHLVCSLLPGSLKFWRLLSCGLSNHLQVVKRGGSSASDFAQSNIDSGPEPRRKRYIERSDDNAEDLFSSTNKRFVLFSLFLYWLLAALRSRRVSVLRALCSYLVERNCCPLVYFFKSFHALKIKILVQLLR